MNFATEQRRQFTADRESEAGAAVFTASRRVCLLEGLENDLLFLERNTNTGVSDFKRHHGRRLAQNRVIRTPATRRQLDVEADAALRREFKRIRQEILKHLLQAFAVRRDAAPEVRIDMDFERQLPRLGFVPERPRHHVDEIGEEDLFGIYRDRAGLNLRQVKNVADEIEQVGAGAMDRAGKLDLLRGQIALRIVCELLAKDQDGIKRRTQLVRHVGEEFGLVLGGQSKLGCFFLERAAGLLDFLVLALDFDVSLGELLGLLLELLVGLLQLLLLRLQLGGKLLRLFQQTFSLHCRLDRIEHDADRRGELLEKHRLQRGEFVN